MSPSATKTRWFRVSRGGAPTWFVIAGVLAVAAMVGLVMYQDSQPKPPGAWASPFTIRDTYPLTAPEIPVDIPSIVLIGDGLTLGEDADVPGPPDEDGEVADVGDAQGFAIRSARWLTWPYLSYAAANTGYTVGADGTGPYITHVADLVRHRPDVVMIQGGYADLGADPMEIEAAASDLFISLQAALPDSLIVVFLDTDMPAVSEAELDVVRDAVRAAAEDREVRVIDPQGWLDLDDHFTEDGIRPNADGHAVLYERLSPLLIEAYQALGEEESSEPIATPSPAAE